MGQEYLLGALPARAAPVDYSYSSFRIRFSFRPKTASAIFPPCFNHYTNITAEIPAIEYLFIFFQQTIDISDKRGDIVLGIGFDVFFQFFSWHPFDCHNLIGIEGKFADRFI